MPNRKHNYSRSDFPQRQNGTVLVIALIFLLLTGTISVTAMQTSLFETKMANNEQLREEAFQKTHGIINALSTEINNFVITGDVGYTNCKSGTSGCDIETIQLDTAPSTLDNTEFDYNIVRKAPLFAPIPFRVSESNASSAKSYSAALFEVNAEYDGSTMNLGKAAIAQGVAIKVANSGQ